MDSDSKSETNPTRNITLESLLDSQGAKDISGVNDGKRKISDSDKYVLHSTLPNKVQRGTVSRAREAALELIAILLQQDINGFFHFTPKTVLLLLLCCTSQSSCSTCISISLVYFLMKMCF